MAKCPLFQKSEKHFFQRQIIFLKGAISLNILKTFKIVFKNVKNWSKMQKIGQQNEENWSKIQKIGQQNEENLSKMQKIGLKRQTFV